jgi:hypothetical protein
MRSITGSEPSSYEIRTDGRTIWIDTEGGTIGRFGRFGIDIHRTVDEQIDGAGACLFCTHAKPTQTDWETFKAKMREQNVPVTDDIKPEWLP